MWVYMLVYQKKYCNPSLELLFLAILIALPHYQTTTATIMVVELA